MARKVDFNLETEQRICDLIPDGQRVIIRCLDAEDEVTDGGIIIPSGLKEKPTEGFIVAVGDEVPPKYLPGHRIWFGKYSGYAFYRIVEKTRHYYTLCNYEDILAHVKETHGDDDRRGNAAAAA